MNTVMRRLRFALLIVPLVTFAGCSGRGNTVSITGKLLKGGAPYVPPSGQLVSVTLVGIEIQDETGKKVQGGDPFLAIVDQTNGSFSVPGPEGYGIPPGKYRVTVTQKLSRDAFNAANPRPKKGVDRETDMLRDKFGVTTSPFIRQVDKSQELTIDLDKPE
jgi:hypothetical protein